MPMNRWATITPEWIFDGIAHLSDYQTSVIHNLSIGKFWRVPCKLLYDGPVLVVKSDIPLWHSFASTVGATTAPTSADLHPGRHAISLMAQHMAVQHPRAGIVEYAHNRHRLARRYEGRVAKVGSRTILIGFPEMVAMQVDTVRKSSVVHHPHLHCFITSCRNQRFVRQTAHVVEGPAPEPATALHEEICRLRDLSGRGHEVRGEGSYRRRPDLSLTVQHNAPQFLATRRHGFS